MTKTVADVSGITRRSLLLTLVPMTEQQRGRRAIEVGPTGRIVAANLARLRDRRGLTTRQLAGALERAGRPIPASGITRMEKAERVVTTDELAALAVVLGVSPSALLLPLDDSPEGRVEVTGGGSVPGNVAWDWADGQRPLKILGSDVGAAWLEYQLYGRPSHRRGRGHYLEGASVRAEITRYVNDALHDLREQGFEPDLGEDGFITWRRRKGGED